MNFMNQQAMLVGYLAELIVIGWSLWYALASVRRRRATREDRARERDRARVQAMEQPIDSYNGEPLGHC